VILPNEMALSGKYMVPGAYTTPPFTVEQAKSNKYNRICFEFNNKRYIFICYLKKNIYIRRSKEKKKREK
jgi:hypothetical protein